jgi:hypothetical protein
MQSDFFDAHHRHWEDANHLFAASHLANADHLYGLAAECGLKRLMMAFGMNVDSATGTPTDKADRVHAAETGRNDIWARYETYRSGHQAATYLLGSTNPFADWDVSQRYFHRSHFDSTRVETHRQGACNVHSLIQKAILEGIVP